MKASSVVGLLISCSVPLSCKGPQQKEGVAVSDTAAPAAAAQPASAVAVDTTGEALWARLQQENYTSWPLWPGKQKYYQGQEPHGALLITYVNSLAQDALTNGASQLPAGAIVVKENYGPDRTLMGATVMEKVDGYDSAHGNWFWAKYAPDGKVEMAGRIDMCYACHEGAAQYDQLWKLEKEKTGKGPPQMKMQ